MQKINNITESDYKNIQEIINKTGLSYYEIKKDDFIYYKEDDKIISFGRIYNIGGNDFELSSLWVDEKYRGEKLGIKIINDLIDKKFNEKNNLFLACKKALEKYYEKVGFKKIENNIPEKLKYTLIWAKENNFDAIIMKYDN